MIEWELTLATEKYDRVGAPGNGTVIIPGFHLIPWPVGSVAQVGAQMYAARRKETPGGV